ncbi:hypothetical protein CGLO_17956 [Colletotrichum gloeosporioides Cg-14]|jgi:hypothetical protein
MKED